MANTALGAEKAIIFISDAHEKFYYEKLKEVRYQAASKRSACMKAGRPAGALKQSGWRLTFTAMVRRASLAMMMRRNRWTGAGGGYWFIIL